MKLPNAENALIEEDKLVTYLLNVSHRRGGTKLSCFILSGMKHRIGSG